MNPASESARRKTGNAGESPAASHTRGAAQPEASQCGGAAAETHADPLRGQRVVLDGAFSSMSLREARRLVRTAGGEAESIVTRRTSMLVLGMAEWPLARDGNVSERLQRADILNRVEATIRVVSEAQFLDLAGSPRHVSPKSYPIETLARLFEIEPDRLWAWRRAGLIDPRAESLRVEDVLSLRSLARLVERRVAPATIAASLRRLGEVLAGVDEALAQIQALASAQDALLREVATVPDPSGGQLHLGFSADEPAPTVIRFVAARPEEPADEYQRYTAAEWFELGQSLEEDGRVEDAADAYRRAVAIEGKFPEALFNLGTVLQTLGRNEAADELYRLVTLQDAQFAAAWYNIADIQDSAGDTAGAIASLRAAIAADARYADAHYNLATLLERVGRAGEAKKHWEAYLKLDPSSGWSQIAREHLGRR